MLKRTVLAIMLLICMLIILPMSAFASQFNDVDSSIGISYMDAINYMSDNSIMVGWPNGDFRPDSSITRAMAVTVLYRLSGDTGTYSASVFTDVSPDSPYYNAIGWAVAVGITNGVTSTSFQPDVGIPRQQLMVMLYRFAGYCGYSQNVFADITGYSDYNYVGNFARTAVAWAYSYAIPYNGTNNNTINPNGIVSRKDMALFSINYRHNVEGIVHGRDDFCFTNSGSNFISGGQKYLMSVEDWSTFEAAGNRLGYTSNTPDLVNSQWGGACFGMSVSLALDYSGKIDLNSNYCNNVGSIYDIPALVNIHDPRHIQVVSPVDQGSVTLSAAESKIHFYQRSWFLVPIYNWAHYSNQSSALHDLLEKQAHGGVGVFCYSFGSADGSTKYHAINVFGVPEEVNSGYKIKIYDNRYGDRSGYIFITDNNGQYSATVNNYDRHNNVKTESIITCRFENNFDEYTINGLVDYYPNRSLVSVSNSQILNNYTILKIISNGDFSITDANGSTISVVNGEVGGTSNIYRWNFIPTNVDSPCEFYFVVPQSSNYRCISADGLICFSATDNSGTIGTSIYDETTSEISSIDIYKNGNVEINKCTTFDIQ